MRPEQLEQPPRDLARALKARALQWLAQREHSRAELRRKLLRYALAPGRGDSQGANPPHAPGQTPPKAACADDDAEPANAQQRVDAVLDWLEAQRHLSMPRFVESRVHARAGRFGNLRIRQELAQHDARLSEDAAQALAESELDRAHAVWQRKFGLAFAATADAPAAASTPAEQARQARFLAGRGFTPEVIRQVLRHAARSATPTDN